MAKRAPDPRKLVEERLHQSEERFRLLVDSVRDYAIFMLDRGGHVLTWNQGAQNIKGYSADEIIGSHLSVFYRPVDVLAGRCELQLERAAREGRSEDEGWRVRKDGTHFWASVMVTALRDRDGELVGYGKVTRDLTERRKLEEERLRGERAKEAIRLRDEFLSIASHELKTPLTILQLQLQNLRHLFTGSIDAERKLERALRSGKRLAELIESLFDVSRIVRGRIELNRQTYDAVDAAREVVDRFREPAHRAGCELLFADDGPVLVSWDRVRIDQVLTNLLSNAVKYGAQAPIEVSIHRNDGSSNVVIDVRDHGSGIPEAELPTLFARFERTISMAQNSGLGLGLFVTNQIVTAHGGTVTASNEATGGARLRVSLPVTPPPTIAVTSPGHA